MEIERALNMKRNWRQEKEKIKKECDIIIP